MYQKRTRKQIAVTITMSLIITLLIVNVRICGASRWSEETLLTDYPWFDGRPSIAQTNDKKVWIVWQRDFFGDNTIWYNTYDGTQWSGEKVLISDSSSATETSMATDHLEDYMYEGASETFNLTINSATGGTTNPPPGIYTYDNGTNVSVEAIPNPDYNFDRWYIDPMPEWTFDFSANPTTITMDNNYDLRPKFSLQTQQYDHTNPSITQLSNGTIIVVWSAEKGGNTELYYITSSDNGLNWGPMNRLTRHLDLDVTPAVMQAKNGTIWVVWCSYREENSDIFFKTYNEGWSTDKRLTINTYPDNNPSIIQTQDRKIWVTWSSNRVGNSEIYYRTHNGTWSNENRLTEDSKEDIDPSIFQMRNGTIRIIWASGSYPSKLNDLYYKDSNDNGDTWSSTFQFTTDEYEDMWPAATQTRLPREIWVVWGSNRAEEPDGNFELWYRKTIVLEGDVNEDEIVDLDDLVFVGLAWAAQWGDPRWNPVADLNDDEIVDIEDLATVGRNYGKKL